MAIEELSNLSLADTDLSIRNRQPMLASLEFCVQKEDFLVTYIKLWFRDAGNNESEEIVRVFGGMEDVIGLLKDHVTDGNDAVALFEKIREQAHSGKRDDIVDFEVFRRVVNIFSEEKSLEH